MSVEFDQKNMFLKKSKGFTLIELLVVISIIGLLSTVVMAGMQTARQRAKNSYVTASIKSYITALKGYYADHGGYPANYGDGCEWAAYYYIGLGKTDYQALGGHFCSYIDSNYFLDQLSPYLSSLDDPSPYENPKPYNDIHNVIYWNRKGAGFVCEDKQTNLYCSKGKIVWVIDTTIDKNVNCGDVGGGSNSMPAEDLQNIFGMDLKNYVYHYCYLNI
ncbi:MAG: type II secretion system protein [Candidatus Paceibacterota bacterium]|jgi:prepilin-type N-terminal cleavage/methylation domain-containing protein